MDQLKEAVALSAINPHDKHVDVLLRSSALCREMGGVTIILCKSGEWLFAVFCCVVYLCLANTCLCEEMKMVYHALSLPHCFSCLRVPLLLLNITHLYYTLTQFLTCATLHPTLPHLKQARTARRWA